MNFGKSNSGKERRSKRRERDAEPSFAMPVVRITLEQLKEMLEDNGYDGTIEALKLDVEKSGHGDMLQQMEVSPKPSPRATPVAMWGPDGPPNGKGASTESVQTVQEKDSLRSKKTKTDPAPVKVFRKDDFEKKKQQHVQLIPSLPEGTAEHDVVIQAGKYESTWIRLLQHFKSVPTAEDIVSWLDDAESNSSAVYIAIPQEALTHPLFHPAMAEILKRKYLFYTCYDVGKELTNELIWYKWTTAGMESRVPRYATSIEGGGLIVISPDGDKVLLVKEYGRWGRCGGAVEAGENLLEAALRECQEETQCEIDDDILPHLGVVYNQPMARDGIINDHFMLFIVRAKSLEIIPDKTEIQDARWFGVAELMKVWEDLESEHKNNPKQPIPDRVEFKSDTAEDAAVIGTMELECVSRYGKGQSIEGKYVVGKFAKPQLRF